MTSKSKGPSGRNGETADKNDGDLGRPKINSGTTMDERLAGENKKGREPGEREILAGLVMKDEFAFDQDGNFYVITTDNSGKKIIINPESKRYKAIISQKYYDEMMGRVPSIKNINEVILVARGKTTKKIWLGVRVAGENIGAMNARVYYDMCDGENAILIEPSPDGSRVSIIPRPLKFRDTGECGPQVMPNLEARISDATKFYPHFMIKAPTFEQEQQDLGEDSMNKMKDKDQIVEDRKKILLGWCVFGLIPDTPEYKLDRPGVKITGPPRSAKSKNTTKLVAVPDPIVGEILGKPRDIASFELALQNRWIPAFDNVNEVTQAESDRLCQAATGIRLSNRELYTNADTVKATFRRPCVLNGVSDILTRPDATDRYISIELQPLTTEWRPPNEIFKEFYDDMPIILGACLKILSVLLYRIAYGDIIQPKIGHRMVDFLSYGMTIADIIARDQATARNIIVLPEYGTMLIDWMTISPELSYDNDAAYAFEREFIDLMKTQETSMIETNTVASVLQEFIESTFKEPVSTGSTGGWVYYETAKKLRDAVLIHIEATTSNRHPDYKRLQEIEPRVFVREIKTFMRNFETVGIQIIIKEPAPGAKSGKNATYRVKYRRVTI